MERQKLASGGVKLTDATRVASVATSTDLVGVKRESGIEKVVRLRDLDLRPLGAGAYDSILDRLDTVSANVSTVQVGNVTSAQHASLVSVVNNLGNEITNVSTITTQNTNRIAAVSARLVSVSQVLDSRIDSLAGTVSFNFNAIASLENRISAVSAIAVAASGGGGGSSNPQFWGGWDPNIGYSNTANSTRGNIIVVTQDTVFHALIAAIDPPTIGATYQAAIARLSAGNVEEIWKTSIWASTEHTNAGARKFALASPVTITANTNVAFLIGRSDGGVSESLGIGFTFEIPQYGFSHYFTAQGLTNNNTVFSSVTLGSTITSINGPPGFAICPIWSFP